MVGLGLLLVVGVVVLVVFLGRRSHPATSERPSIRAQDAVRGEVSPEVDAVLARAVAAGLIGQDAATSIVAAERARLGAVAPAASPRSVPPVAEAIGYVGGILVMVGMVAVVERVWDDLATAARLGIVGGAALLLLVVGTLLRDESDEVVWRLRSFVWLLSAGALAGFVGILTVDALGWEGEPVAVAIGAIVAAFSLALWQLKDRPAQQLTAFVGMLVMLGGMAASLQGQVAVGVAVFLAGAAWLALGYRRLLPPVLAALLLGSIAVLVGSGIMAGTTSMEKAGPLVGLVAAIALVGAGTLVHQLVVTGVGVGGLFVFLPWTLGAVFGDAIGPPLVFLISGVLLLVVMVVLLRRHGHDGGLGTGGLAPPAAV